MLARMQSKAVLFVLLLGSLGCHAFHNIQTRPNTFPSVTSMASRQRWDLPITTTTHLSMAEEDSDDSTENKAVTSPSPLGRILSPKIDDRGLPIIDALVAQIIGPSLQVFYLVLSGSPRPTWLNPYYDGTFAQYRGALLVPTLLHGAALSCCWILGALAARGYENDAIDPTIAGPSTVALRVFQAGCFASGCLVFATQMDLLGEFGRWVQPGESPEIDSRILTAAVEVTNDIFFSICAIVPIRWYLAATIVKNK